MYDVIIRGGRVLDGTGTPPVSADVAISGGRIAAIGRALGDAPEVIDARGLAVAPGFIDIHAHSDFTLWLDPSVDSKVRQGVTTELVGNCGLTAGPVAAEHQAELLDYLANTVPLSEAQKRAWSWPGQRDFLDAALGGGARHNVAWLVGQGTVRVAVMGYRPGPAAPAELAAMRALVQRELDRGAFGLSSGLQYPPNSFAAVEETAALAEAVAAAGGVLAVHMRDECAGLLAAVDEAVAVAERAGVSLQIAHLKAAGRANWGASAAALGRLHAAADRGLPVAADAYPYPAYVSSILDLMPPWAAAQGPQAIVALLAQAGQRARIVAELDQGLPGWENPKTEAGWDGIRIASVASGERAWMQGRTLDDLARAAGTPPAELVADLAAAERGAVKLIVHAMDEAEVRAILADPLVMVASDGRAVAQGGPTAQWFPHPRYFGAMARALGPYRRGGVFTLEEAVRKMTSMPAAKIGLRGRGVLGPGAHADVVVFDPEAVDDVATFTEPRRHPAGIGWVLVAGQAVVREGATTHALPGRLLMRGAA